jgi:hypothetical protein
MAGKILRPSLDSNADIRVDYALIAAAAGAALAALVYLILT